MKKIIEMALSSTRQKIEATITIEKDYELPLFSTNDGFAAYLQKNTIYGIEITDNEIFRLMEIETTGKEKGTRQMQIDENLEAGSLVRIRGQNVRLTVAKSYELLMDHGMVKVVWFDENVQLQKAELPIKILERLG